MNKLPRIVYGNDLNIKIYVTELIDGEPVPYDLTECTDIQVQMFCSKHKTMFELPFTIDEQDSSIINAQIDYRLTHPNTMYGFVINGYDRDEQHFQWVQKPNEGIMYIEGSSGAYIDTSIDNTVDISARIGFNLGMSNVYSKDEVDDLVDAKQDTLVSGVNIKTINHKSILGSGNITIQGGGGGGGDQVQADWNQTDDTEPDYIWNKPTIPTKTSDLTNDSDFIDGTELATDLATKQNTLVSGINIKTINNESILGEGNIDIQSGSEQEQADWNQTDTSAVDYIKNKPDLSVYAETSDLATVATTGDYNDLSNTPDLSNYVTKTNEIDKYRIVIPWQYSTIDNVEYVYFTFQVFNNVTNELVWQPAKYSTLNEVIHTLETIYNLTVEIKSNITLEEVVINIDNSSNLYRFKYRNIYTRGIKIVVHKVINNSYIHTEDGGMIQSNYIIPYNKYSDVAYTNDYTDLSNTPDLSVYAESSDLATVATTGDYTDLSNTPDLSVYAESSDLATVATSGDYTDLSNTPDLSIYAESSDLATVATSGSYNDLSNTPDLSVYAESSDLATVATSGSYNDLSNTPDLSIYAESSDLATVATSGDYNDLSNTPDLSIYAESSDLATVATSGDYTDLSNKPTIPAAQIQSDYEQTDDTQLDYIKNKPTFEEPKIIFTEETPSVQEEGAIYVESPVYDIKETKINIVDERPTTIDEDTIVIVNNLIQLKTINNQEIVGEGNIKIQTGDIIYENEYFTITSLEDNNIIGWETNYNGMTKTISVSADYGQTWTSYKSTENGVQIATLNAGDKLFVKGTEKSYGEVGSTNSNFTSTKKFNVSGNIMSMLYGDDFVGQTVLPTYNNGTFVFLFKDCIKLISAENLILPATTLMGYCYGSMFYGCTSLTTTPELPATTLTNTCYHSMFRGCTSLTTAPELPATTLAQYCYGYMFYGCQNLNFVKVNATSSASSSFDSWLDVVNSTGTIIKPSSLVLPASASGIPTGWNAYTEQEYEPIRVKDNVITSSTSGLKIEVVAALPANPDNNTIYIVQ